MRYLELVHIGSSLRSEIRLTLEVAIDMANQLVDGDLDARSVLVEGGFTRAGAASEASMRRVHDRMGELVALLSAMPDLETGAALGLINEELTELPVSPSVVDHDGVGPHIHWTPNTATFDDQVITDVVMALAQEMGENGTSRFGRCAAEDCSRLYYDGTRNHSRKFCSDPRCASRTHTADHRARQRDEDSGEKT